MNSNWIFLIKLMSRLEHIPQNHDPTADSRFAFLFEFDFSKRRGQSKASTQSQEFLRTLQCYEKQDAINVLSLGSSKQSNLTGSSQGAREFYLMISLGTSKKVNSNQGSLYERHQTFSLSCLFATMEKMHCYYVYNTKALNIFPYPWLLASSQLFCGPVWMLMLRSFKLQPCPKIDKKFIVALLGPALLYTIGHISACVSISKIVVSFTHVIKSVELEVKRCDVPE